MSIILGNYNKKKISKVSKDGYVQTIPPANDIPPSWSDNEHRIFISKKESGDITEWRNENGDITHYTERKLKIMNNKVVSLDKYREYMSLE